MGFIEVDPRKFDESIFDLLDRSWGLAMAGTAPEHCNAMTIGWGQIGMFWGRPASTVFIRESRFTKEFIDACDTFSVAFLPPELHGKHKVFGTMSGRDVDKTELTGLTPIMIDGTPLYEESMLVFLCRKAYVDTVDHKNFVDETAYRRYYDRGADRDDWHSMYIAYVEKILRKE
ncbi:flavin reductase family protein [Coriobacteriales bacterium OH1046]|nr:flavin reductase family protein [Coriobacteriales bacterium OH1046]